MTQSRDTLPLLFGQKVSSIHCVGVAGMGVGPLAIYLAQRGYTVSGEDDSMTDAMREQLDIARITLTSAGGVPPSCDLVCYSSAISAEHPAYIAARARKIPLVRRGELLAEVTRDRLLVGVCGSHGKTTTTAMLITALRAAGFPAGYVLGGLFNDPRVSPASAGTNEWVVAEIDESDGTIERFSPEITVAVNLDWDHPDRYREQKELEQTFEALFRRTRRAVVLNEACPISARIAASKAHAQMLTFGRIAANFQAVVQREEAGTQWLRLSGHFADIEAAVAANGDFNASNATAALAAAQLMGETLSSELLADYPGVRRRQSVLHAADGLRVIEDYAHHPAEIRALLSSLRRHSEGRLLAVFQPHRFSRNAQFKAQFAESLMSADRVYLLDVYSAGEGFVAGGTTGDLYAELRARAPQLSVSYFADRPEALLRQLGRDLSPGDLVAFVGAGDIDQEARRWLADLGTQREAARRWDDFARRLESTVSAETKVRREESLAQKTTMRVGGAARVYAEPATAEDVRVLLTTANEWNIPVHVLGRGSNVIVPDDGVEGLVFSFAHSNWQTFEPRPDGTVWVGAGLRLKNLCGLATKAGLVGFEFLEGIPGNVGGALRMNAGAMGGWMFDVVEHVQMITFAGEIRTMRKAEMHVDYRHCEELHHAIALGALLKPKAQASAEDINRQIDAYREKRQKTQPREPSAGCIFKNPAGTSAGKLIDEAGLKGERVGDAEVSPIHANFIVNRGDATSADIIQLVRRVRARVEKAKGIKLEPEVLLYGQEWRDVL